MHLLYRLNCQYPLNHSNDSFLSSRHILFAFRNNCPTVLLLYALFPSNFPQPFLLQIILAVVHTIKRKGNVSVHPKQRRIQITTAEIWQMIRPSDDDNQSSERYIAQFTSQMIIFSCNQVEMAFSRFPAFSFFPFTITLYELSSRHIKYQHFLQIFI